MAMEKENRRTIVFDKRKISGVQAAQRIKARFAAIDTPFLATVVFLVAFGLIMLFSASHVTAFYRFKNSFHFIRSQAIFAVAGLVIMLAVSQIDYKFYKPFAWPLMAVTWILLVVVLFMPALNDAKRWINLKITTFQPSEVAKFAIILLFSFLIAQNGERIRSRKLLESFQFGFLPFAGILIITSALMLLEPHLSGTLLILSIGAILMFSGGTRLIWFGISAAVGAAGALSALVMVKKLVPYAAGRIQTWLNPWADASDAGHQTVQGLLAIGSGGFWGVGLGNSRQKHLYVPEPQNDFIFSIIAEELGFIGAMLVIVLFAVLLFRGIYIATRAKDPFGTMLGVGIIAQVSLQAALNIAVVTNTIPNTGISLPFFSYGGTSLLMLLGEMGIVLSISRDIQQPSEEETGKPKLSSVKNAAGGKGTKA